MNVTVATPAPVPVIIELTGTEAERLCGLLARHESYTEDSLYNRLNRLGVKPRPVSVGPYSDNIFRVVDR